MALVEMRLFEIRRDDVAQDHVIVLREVGGSRMLPIVIGIGEARAVELKVKNISLQRPLTHDLMKSIIEALGARLERIVVTALEQKTYYARLYFKNAAGEDVDVDARPSDSIALALRVGAPIYVDEEVLEKSAV